MRGRWPLNQTSCNNVDLPSLDLCCRQADWLRGARSRLLRRAGIERRNRVVELGAGWGIVASELCSRIGRKVVALDRRPRPTGIHLHENVDWLEARAEELPLASESVDLFFAQFTFLWLDAQRSISEIVRVLTPGGVVAVIEPDYGGLMEYPEEIVTRPLWLASLRRAGADPFIGRKLPSLLSTAGLRVETRFPDHYETASPSRLDFLSELALSLDEQQQLDVIRQWHQVHPTRGISHLPLWMVLGEKPA